MTYDELPNLDRAALLVRPRQPFQDWVLKQEPGITFDQEFLAGDIYLLPDLESQAEMKDWLKKNYALLFSALLSNWYLDEKMWPADRTWEMFEAWFACSYHPLVFDTVEGDIEKF